MSGRLVGIAAVCLLLYAGPVRAQAYRPDPAPGEQGSANIKIVSHLPLNVSAPYNTSDIEIEQELSRPYVYVDHANEAGARSPTIGFDIISIKDPGKPQVIYTWHIENQELHRGAGSLGPTYIKTHGRYYFFNGFQFQVGGPDVDLGAIVWDVTGLPDTSKIKEVAGVRVPEFPGGVGGAFVYDITDPTNPKVIASITGVAGACAFHTFTPTPDGRYAITMPLFTYQYSVARVFDLKPALDGTVQTVSRPIGAWTP